MTVALSAAIRTLFAVAVAAVVLAPGAAYAVTVERVVSPGGIEAWLVRDSMVPLVAIEFSFRGGAALDPAGKAGLADITTSLLDEGAGDMDSQAYQRKLSDLAIEMRFSAGADTIRGSFKTLNRNRDEAVELLRLALTAPRFDAGAVERIRQQILALLSRKSTDPDEIAGRVWWRAVFPDHPYGTPVEGTPQSIAAVTAADMRRLVTERFARDQLIVGVVGDIAPDELGPLLDRAFGSLPATGKKVQLRKAEIHAAGQTFIVRQDVPQSVVLFGHAGIKRDHPDYYVAYVMNYVLGGGGFSSRLYDEVREKRGLAYSVYSYLSPMDAAATYAGGVSTENSRVGESLAVIRAEWAHMRDGGVTDAELKDAKTYLTGSFPLRFTSTDRIARMLVGMQYNDLGIDYIDRRNGFIEAVTGDDVARVAKSLLKPDDLTFVIVGDPAGVEATSEAPDIGG
ncbi:MAG: insulinase family protein [Alphaproteobacteria bacterium]|nr:insulinase family protein [Alphaproteobacteria bacterium]